MLRMRVMPLFLVLLASTVHALQVPQQRGNACAVVWDVGDATAVPGALRRQPWELVCADGDTRCDHDGLVNDACEITVAACVGPSDSDCVPEPLTGLRIPKATRSALRGFVPPVAGALDSCGTPGTVVLKASGERRRSVLLSLRSRAASGRGRNRLRVRCVPAADCVDCPTACDPDACARSEAGLPSAMTLTIGSTGSDLDLGFSGDNHNHTLAAPTRLDLCLDGCDAATDAICEATLKCEPVAGEPIGPPQPLLSNGVPVCVVTRRTASADPGTFDLRTGAMTVPLELQSEVYTQTADPSGDNVCPRCSGLALGDRGTCEAGERRGLDCIVDGTARVVGSGGPGQDYNLSSQCPPDVAKLATTLPVSLVLTTADAVLDGPLPCRDQLVDDSCGAGTCTVDCSTTEPARGGVNQTCCSNNVNKPCFPTAPDGSGRIERVGVARAPLPGWPDTNYPKTGTGALLAGTFCLPKTNDATVDILTGLPGPGAVLVPVTVDVTAQE